MVDSTGVLFNHLAGLAGSKMSMEVCDGRGWHLKSCVPKRFCACAKLLRNPDYVFTLLSSLRGLGEVVDVNRFNKVAQWKGVQLCADGHFDACYHSKLHSGNVSSTFVEDGMGCACVPVSLDVNYFFGSEWKGCVQEELEYLKREWSTVNQTNSDESRARRFNVLTRFVGIPKALIAHGKLGWHLNTCETIHEGNQSCDCWKPMYESETYLKEVLVRETQEKVRFLEAMTVSKKKKKSHWSKLLNNIVWPIISKLD